MGPTEISEHWVNIVLMMYFPVYINFQIKVYYKWDLKNIKLFLNYREICRRGPNYIQQW